MRKIISLIICLSFVYTNVFGLTVGYSRSFAVGADCLSGTYLSAWNGEYPSDTDKACFASGASQKDPSVAPVGVNFSTDYGNDGQIGMQFPAKDDYVTYANAAEDGFVENEGTLYIEVYFPTITNTATIYFFEILNAANPGTEQMTIGLRADDALFIQRIGGGVTDGANSGGSTLSAATWYTVGMTWSVGRGTNDFMWTINKGSSWGGDGVEGIASMVVDSGTTDGTTANKLVDSTQNFTSTVSTGMIVINTTDSTQTTVTAVDNNSTLSLNDDIMVSGETYKIGHFPDVIRPGNLHVGSDNHEYWINRWQIKTGWQSTCDW